MANVTIPLANLLAQTAEGQQLQQLAMLGTMLGVHDRTSDNDNAYMNGIANYSLFTPQAVTLVVSQGGEVENYPAFLELTPEQYTENVPSYVPNATTVDESETETPLTWSEWKDSVHEHAEFASKHYVPLNANTGSKDCSGSVIAQLISGGFTVLSQPQYQAIVVANSPNIE